jgi:hypothetical protein
LRRRDLIRVLMLEGGDNVPQRVKHTRLIIDDQDLL